MNSSLFRCCFRDNFPEYSGNAYRVKKVFIEKIPIKKPSADQAQLLSQLVDLVQASKSLEHRSSNFLEDLVDASVFEIYFPVHMAERNLLIADAIRTTLDTFNGCEPKLNGENLDELYRHWNSPDSPIRNRLLRMSADSPDLLAVIKTEGQV